jgi:Protein of unknown function (DUF1566)
MKNRLLLGVVVLAFGIITTLPGLVVAGSLEPSGPPGPTMRTLDEIYSTNSWSKKLPCDSQTNCPRFEVLADFNNEAVLDKETGLVWEQSPGTNIYGLQAAQNRCNDLCRYNTSGRCGWRLPAVQELESLIDPTRFSLHGVSTLPGGNPFSNVQVDENAFGGLKYWSATVSPWGGTQSAWSVTFTPGNPPKSVGAVTNEEYIWCVRGGSGVDAQ